jgi:hypothetical protein
MQRRKVMRRQFWRTVGTTATSTSASVVLFLAAAGNRRYLYIFFIFFLDFSDGWNRRYSLYFLKKNVFFPQIVLIIFLFPKATNVLN